MAMNLLHRRCCSSRRWARQVEEQMVPWALAEVDLGDDVLEIGPGYGANIKVLIDRAPRYTAVEIDPVLAERLQGEYGSRARIINGDGTATGLPAAAFSAVVCFTMLHHVPTPELQDRLFAEAFRVLRPGGCSPAATACRPGTSGCCTSGTPTTRCRRSRCRTGCGAADSPTSTW